MKIAAVTGALVILGLLADCQVYLLREHSGGSLLWNNNEAYLFIGLAREGHHVSCLRYPWLTFKEYFGAVEESDDGIAFLDVIAVTSSGVERHSLKLQGNGPDAGPDHYTPWNGRIYAKYPALGGLVWWASDHFEPATKEERKHFDETKGLKTMDFDNDAGGWSRRGFVDKPLDYSFRIEAGDQFTLTVRNTPAGKSGNGNLSIDFLRNGLAPEKLWDFHGRQGVVTRAQYERALVNRN